MIWLIYSLLSALFAAGLPIAIKLGNKDLNVYTVTVIRFFFMFLVSLLFSLFVNKMSFSLDGFTTKEWLLVVVSGIFGGLGYLFYFVALNHNNPSAVLSVTQWTIIITMLLSYLLLGESISFLKILGGLILVGGSYLIINY